MGVCYRGNMTWGCLNSAELFAWSDIGTDFLYRKAGLSALHLEKFHTPFAAHIIILWSYAWTLSLTVSLSHLPILCTLGQVSRGWWAVGVLRTHTSFFIPPCSSSVCSSNLKIIVFYLHLISKDHLDFKKDNAFLLIFTNTISYCNNCGK